MPSPELVAYGLLALGLAVLLWSHVGDVDGFYLDEWFYVHGAQYIWGQLPGGLVESIPEWNRGPQRLYSTLLAAIWGPLGTSTAFTLSHVLNVALLVSAIVPAALLARRVIDVPLLRVLAVALGVAVPWLAIGSHMLTENLAYPLYLWAIYWIVHASQEPSWRSQAGALAALAALAVCRLNLAFVAVALFVAVGVAEGLLRRSERGQALGDWSRRALRREALVVAAGLVALAAAVFLAARGTAGVSAHYELDLDTVLERLFGAGAGDTRRTMLTYTRSLVTGAFVFPFAIGVGVALAGAIGRAGSRLLIPSIAALTGAAAVILVVSVSTVGGSIEERYIFYVYTPIALLAVAGLDQAYRLRRWIAAGSAGALWALIAGFPAQAADAGHFFASPAGAFWSRVLHHRLVGWEQDLFGWMFIGQPGWLLVALGLGAMLLFVGRFHARPRLVTAVLGGGLAACALAQALVLDYAFKQELRGTTDVPGGIALSSDRAADRETWLDEALSGGRRATVIPAVPTPSDPWGGVERLSLWNEALDASISLGWTGATSPTPPGYVHQDALLGADGLARWQRPEWLAAQEDDPRVQFAGRIVARSPVSAYALYRTAASRRAVWTSAGLEPDGAVIARHPVTMALDRRAAAAGAVPGAVVITLESAAGARAGVRWRLTRAGRSVAAGRLRPEASRPIRLSVPPCGSARDCAPVRWVLRASGRAVGIPFPGYGAPGAPRPVVLQVTSARIVD